MHPVIYKHTWALWASDRCINWPHGVSLTHFQAQKLNRADWAVAHGPPAVWFFKLIHRQRVWLPLRNSHPRRRNRWDCASYANYCTLISSSFFLIQWVLKHTLASHKLCGRVLVFQIGTHKYVTKQPWRLRSVSASCLINVLGNNKSSCCKGRTAICVTVCLWSFAHQYSGSVGSSVSGDSCHLVVIQAS